jgi:predicted dehydrogenase
MESKLRIGIIGLGQRGPMHVRESMRFEYVEIAALCDLYKDRVEDMADYVEEKTGKRPFETQDCDELIAHGGLDAIIVSTS